MLEVTVCDGRVHEELPMARLFVVDGWERERDSRTGGAFDFSALTGTHTEVITHLRCNACSDFRLEPIQGFVFFLFFSFPNGSNSRFRLNEFQARVCLDLIITGVCSETLAAGVGLLTG